MSPDGGVALGVTILASRAAQVVPSNGPCVGNNPDAPSYGLGGGASHQTSASANVARATNIARKGNGFFIGTPSVLAVQRKCPGGDTGSGTARIVRAGRQNQKSKQKNPS